MGKVKDIKNKTQAQKKPANKSEQILDMSLEERLTHENKVWVKGTPRPVAREAVKLWYTIPSTFLGMREDLARKLGITDPDVLWLLQFQTQREIAAAVGMAHPYVCTWIKEFHQTGQFNEVKAFFRKLTKNVMGALYRKALQDGDAARVKFYMQCIEDWKEQFGVDTTATYVLDPDEKKELDRLLAQNTK